MRKKAAKRREILVSVPEALKQIDALLEIGRRIIDGPKTETKVKESKQLKLL